MIEDFVQEDFHEPPAALSFERRYRDLLAEVENAARTCLDTTPQDSVFAQAATRLYIVVQAIPSVLLNYKICIDFGLPLHPTKYIDFAHEQKNLDAYLPSTRQTAQELLLDAIDISQSVYRLDPICPIRLRGLAARIPEFLSGFIYTNTPDRYTWRASDPACVKSVARKVKESGWAPDLILGAAHGSIRPGLLLANLLGCQLYFVRFSMFKRDDESPILSPSDEAFLARYRRKRVLIFDEDVAKGRTLRAFADRFAGCFGEVRTGAVLRHYLSPFEPTVVGEMFFDD